MQWVFFLWLVVQVLVVVQNLAAILLHAVLLQLHAAQLQLHAAHTKVNAAINLSFMLRKKAPLGAFFIFYSSLRSLRFIKSFLIHKLTHASQLLFDKLTIIQA